MEPFIFFIFGAASACLSAVACVPFIRRHNAGFRLNTYHIAFSGLLGGIFWYLCNKIYGNTADCFFFCAFAALLCAASFSDFCCQLVPESLHLIIIVLAVASWISDRAPSLKSRILGFVIVSVPLFVCSRLIESFGIADVKLFAASGLLIGAQNTVLAFFIAAASAAVYGLFLVKARGKSIKTRIAFVPFISVGLLFSGIFGERTILWYLSLL